MNRDLRPITPAEAELLRRAGDSSKNPKRKAEMDSIESKIKRATELSPANALPLSDCPTERGWYWYHNGNKHSSWRLLCVDKQPRGGYFYVSNDPAKYCYNWSVEKMPGVWAGPITPPTHEVLVNECE